MQGTGDTEDRGRKIVAFVRRWGDVLVGSSVPALVIDTASGEVRLCNDAAVRLLGTAPRSFEEAVPLADTRVRIRTACAVAGFWDGEIDDRRVAAAGIACADEGSAGIYLSFPGGNPPSRELPAGLLDPWDDAFVGVDMDDRIVYVNGTASRMFGPALLGRRVAACLPSGAHTALTGDDVDELVSTPDGERHVRWRSVRVWTLGEAEILLLRARDITAEHEAQRLNAEARRRDAAHAIALAVGRGVPVHELTEGALAALDGVLAVRELRVTVLEGDTSRLLAGRRGGMAVYDEGRASVEGSPAASARAHRAPEQRAVAASIAEFPALVPLEATGVRAVLYVPIAVPDAVLGFLELHSATRDVFPATDVELVQEVAGVLATAIVRERLMEQVARHAQAMELRATLRGEELTRTQEQLIQAAKLSSIGELAAGLVHELNQPLNVLGGYVELLREGSLAEGGRERALDVMGRAVERMISMVDNLRNFSRSSGPVAVPVDIAAVVTMARELTVGAHKRRVEASCAPGLVVLGDPNRLEQVFINLIANALQCGGDPVAITSYDAPGDRVVVEVTDRGPGVPEELRARIFEPFFTTKPPGQGTGLGLSVSARIVQEHNGRIEITDNPGGGALFRVVLPRHRTRQSVA
jgi:signal transduction histidine kinase